MKTALMLLLMAGASATGVAKPGPPHADARNQLPVQASENARPSNKFVALPIVPPIQVTIPPLPAIPPIVVTATLGQQPTQAQQQAIVAINSATTTAKAAVNRSPNVSIITMTGTRVNLEVTRLRPRGRTGDLETGTWRFNDRFGRRIGTGTLLCRWATVVRRVCWGEIRLPLGKLAVIGSAQTRSIGQLAVVGGTGKYLFQQGVLTFSATGRGKFAVRVVLA